MALVPYRPYSLFNDLEKNYGKLFSELLAGVPASQMAQGADDSWTPAVDIHEEENSYVVHADIPGVDPKDIEVTLDNNILSIRGERKTESTSEESGVKRIERFQGSFFRQFTLPKTVNTEMIQAKGKNGVLTITIPKSEEVRAKRIEVN